MTDIITSGGKPIQAEIIRDWINQIITTIESEKHLLAECHKRYGPAICNRYESFIRDEYNHHRRMMEEEMVMNQWDEEEIDDYNERYGNII
tara:strand:+ start:345 stop:617 length:273 start_codon:yes stop_codon:yes gene_type:complete